MSATAPERPMANATAQTPRASAKQIATWPIFDRILESGGDIGLLVRAPTNHVHRSATLTRPRECEKGTEILIAIEAPPSNLDARTGRLFLRHLQFAEGFNARYKVRDSACCVRLELRCQSWKPEEPAFLILKNKVRRAYHAGQTGLGAAHCIHSFY